jgi:hypothetical protein
MSSGGLTCDSMARPKKVEPAPEAEPVASDRKRVPIKITEDTHDKLREMAFVWFRKPIEELAGDWLRERVLAEYKKGRPKQA